MKDYLIYNNQKISEGSVITTSAYPDVMWILHEGWYRIDDVNYVGWYLSSIPDNRTIAVTEDLLGTTTVISGSAPVSSWWRSKPIQCTYGITEFAEIASQFGSYLIAVEVEDIQLIATKLDSVSATMLFTAIAGDRVYSVELSDKGWSELHQHTVVLKPEENTKTE